MRKDPTLDNYKQVFQAFVDKANGEPYRKFL